MKNKISYIFANKNQVEYIEKMIARDILANQTALVERLLNLEIFNWEDIQNYDGEITNKDVFQWFLLTDDFIEKKLKELGEPILKNDFGTWWGRTCFGQAIVIDSTFWDIYQNEVKNIK